MATLCNSNLVSCAGNLAAGSSLSEICTGRRISLSFMFIGRPLDLGQKLDLTKRISARRNSRIFSVYNPSVVEESNQSEDTDADLIEEAAEEEIRRTVGVFWDLDNKPPKGVAPYKAAISLRDLASEFGLVVDMVAYANHHAFTYVPQWIRDERQERKRLSVLEEQGAVKPEEPYICQFCGRKCQTYLKLLKHFKQLHEKERTKRMNHLKTLKGKRRQKFKAKLAEKEDKYQAIATQLLVPKKGYGLATELKRAGVYVRTVEDKPQAADEALIKHMTDYINKGLETLILISDDSDFVDILRFASRRNLQTIVIGDLMVLSKHADISFSWDEVASGRAQLAAAEAHKEWTNKAALIRELEDDSYLSSEQEDSEFTTVRSRLRISTFSEEEFFDSDDDVDDDDEAFDDYSDDEEESAFEDFSPWSRRAAGDINKVY
ncbi:uncharacterized protein [Physcomitrium patens]|uniref:C2H2-type domain-containing protein n=1 Tax=Physcomitrium patens TaxID=3218 RepID=A0A2K1JX78_PHYPA|nr:uncharacterized protein LOC112288058 [Physcomitrium patens]PNR46136.1 hypothetical protein PHYPA_013255 [Physcomitrium patens]|eukprot:XP_024387619.1 uncharacterized protein LOC112288058 [Physcomitrella patens]